jgi:chromosome partitioning protein
LKLFGIALTMYQKSKLCNTVVDEVRKHFSSQVFKTVIPRNIDIAAAPSEGAPITLLKKPNRSNKGSQQYWAMAKELHQRVNFIRKKYGINEPSRLSAYKIRLGK